MKIIDKSDVIKNGEFVDTETLKIVFSCLILNVVSINKKYGAVKSFMDTYNLNGITNGKLLIRSQMVIPPFELYQVVERQLEPLGFVENEDFVFADEQLTVGVDRYHKGYKEIPELQDIDWLGSSITKEGNFVWYRDVDDWESYREWRQKEHEQFDVNGYYPLLLKKYFNKYNKEIANEAVVIETRGVYLVYGLKNIKGVSKIEIKELIRFRDQLGKFWYKE